MGSTARSHRIAIDAQRDLRLAVAAHPVRVPLSVSEHDCAEALRRLILDDIKRVEDGPAHFVPAASATFTAPLIVLVGLFDLDGRLALAAARPIKCIPSVGPPANSRNHDIGGGCGPAGRRTLRLKLSAKVAWCLRPKGGRERPAQSRTR